MLKPTIQSVISFAAIAAPTVAFADVERQIDARSGPVMVERLADRLNHPWGMAFLPDGRLLVTERAGRLHILSSEGELSEPLEGVPDVASSGQGGLLDVAVGPDFVSTGWIYLSYSAKGEDGSATAVGRGRLDGDTLVGFKTLFHQQPFVDSNKHFGGRIAFSPDGHLFLTTGERGLFDPAQDLSNHFGTVIRIAPDGSVPEDNPFVGKGDARPEIWSYGHRNIQGAAFHPETNELWIVEMGPRGGDELNRVERAGNYGWPLVSWGTHYNGADIPDPPTRPEFIDAYKQWTPVIAPSGMIFYTGDMFPQWRGSALIGGLRAEAIVRVPFSDGSVTKDAEEERIHLDARVRDVEQAPDGSIYVLTDEGNGRILRLSRQ
ncbi:MAG: PQQ-dependent sugar dehydrogenase [Rhodobiaceae bacterium]|nr:PQQ-dependent sugar dehydrogenase [Rhodobiaceae bacterium]MCC0055929.1 PQQ-dependent sugar dehydrogenase [Rhodobiaceae bacterium]